MADHIPVLIKETIECLDLKKGDFVIDGTVGTGGHASRILDLIGKSGSLLCVDWDNDQIQKTEENINSEKNKNVMFAQGNYADIKDILKNKNLNKADAVLIDLGFSSVQLESSNRGFTFQRNEPLDMRYDTVGNSMTAMEVVNFYRESELADILWKYGEERFSQRIAKSIVEARRKKRLITTFDLIEAISKRIPKYAQYSRINFATKTFQALRIYVNNELENLEKFLINLTSILKPKGRAVIISFHSLEDRIVKNYFRGLNKEGKAIILTKKPITASVEEIQENPRSRSAKLRAIQLL